MEGKGKGPWRNVMRSSGRGGCFCWSLRRVALSKGAIVSELLTNRTAPLTSASSSFLETTAASRESAFFPLLLRFWGGSAGLARDSKSDDDRKAEHCLLMRLAKEDLRLWPPLSGCLKHKEGANMRRRQWAGSAGSWRIRSIQSVKVRAHCTLAPRGTNLKIRPLTNRISDNILSGSQERYYNIVVIRQRLSVRDRRRIIPGRNSIWHMTTCLERAVNEKAATFTKADVFITERTAGRMVYHLCILHHRYLKKRK